MTCTWDYKNGHHTQPTLCGKHCCATCFSSPGKEISLSSINISHCCGAEPHKPETYFSNPRELKMLLDFSCLDRHKITASEKFPGKIYKRFFGLFVFTKWAFQHKLFPLQHTAKFGALARASLWAMLFHFLSSEEIPSSLPVQRVAMQSPPRLLVAQHVSWPRNWTWSGYSTKP